MVMLPMMLAAMSCEQGDAGAEPAQTTTPAPSGGSIVLGVQTHFGQGWPGTLARPLAASAAPTIRDTLGWARGEPRPGVYELDGPRVAPLAAFCRGGGTLLLTLDPRNPLYDGGRSVGSDMGRRAFAAYVGAVLDKFDACVTGIEIGNEINDKRNLDYPAADVPTAYVALVRAVRSVVKAAHPRVMLLGGSTNTIGTGFLDLLFAAGLLDVADAIAIHPYRPHAEGLDVELANLNAAMRRRGRVLPIWATEFSDNYDTSERAADELVKTVALMAASGVPRAYWYALIDQRFFRNMGLYSASGGDKPAAQAFAMLQRQVLPAGNAVRMGVGDGLSYVIRFGADRWVVWGAPRPVRFAGSAVSVTDARGRTIAVPAQVDERPIVVTGASAVTLGDGSVLADSMIGYGTSAWSYLARTPDAVDHPLAMLDDSFTSFHASKFYRPLRIGEAQAAPAGNAARATRAVVRYTAPDAMHGVVGGCFAKQPGGDGVDITVTAGGRNLWAGILTDRIALPPQAFDVARGGRIEVAFGPNGVPGKDSLRYRLRLGRSAADVRVECP